MCQFCLACASQTWPSLPRGWGFWNLSKPPLFCLALFDEFFASFWAAFAFCDILLLTFPQLRFFLKLLTRMIWPLAIAPNTSVHGPRIRNIRHSADPPPSPVFLTPPPLLSPLMSLAPVPLLSSSLLSEPSDNFDDDDLPSCPNEASSSLSSASYSTVSLRS